MKKILIIFLSLLLSFSAQANDAKIDEFNKWLLENGHTQYLNIEQKAECKKLIKQFGLKLPKVGLLDEPKYKSMEWFSNKCHEFQGTNNLKIKKKKKKMVKFVTQFHGMQKKLVMTLYYIMDL